MVEIFQRRHTKKQKLVNSMQRGMLAVEKARRNNTILEGIIHFDNLLGKK